MCKVEEQLRSRWGEYMPQVFTLEAIIIALQPTLPSPSTIATTIAIICITLIIVVIIFTIFTLIYGIKMIFTLLLLLLLIKSQVFVLTNGRPLICLHCTETYIMCGEEKTGRLIIYNR